MRKGHSVSSLPVLVGNVGSFESSILAKEKMSLKKQSLRNSQKYLIFNFHNLLLNIWRGNSNRFILKRYIANIEEWDFLSDFQTLCRPSLASNTKFW